MLHDVTRAVSVTVTPVTSQLHHFCEQRLNDSLRLQTACVSLETLKTSACFVVSLMKSGSKPQCHIGEGRLLRKTTATQGVEKVPFSSVLEVFHATREGLGPTPD